MHSPVTAHLPVIAAHTVPFAGTRPQVASHFTIVGLRLIAAVSLILLAAGSSDQSEQEPFAALQPELFLPLGQMLDTDSTRRAV
jgi:hypothetical protein